MANSDAAHVILQDNAAFYLLYIENEILIILQNIILSVFNIVESITSDIIWYTCSHPLKN
jgi:hypothetical protein